MASKEVSVMSVMKHFEDVRIIDREEIKRKDSVGEGSFAVVYKGIWDSSGCDVAIKQFRKLRFQGKALANSEEETLRQIVEEFKIWKGLNGFPNIANLFGVCLFNEDSLPCLIIEWINKSLSRALEESPDAEMLQGGLKLNVLMQVCNGLRFLNKNKLTHGDLTANNVLVDVRVNEVTAKISDFGLAKCFSSLQSNSSGSYSRGMTCYMPPEVRDACCEPHIKTDCYSYGVLIIHTLTGKLPAPKGSIVHFENEPFYLTEFQRYEDCVKDLTKDYKELKVLIERCIEHVPSKRPDPSEIKKCLSQIISNQPISLAPAPAPPTIIKNYIEYHHHDHGVHLENCTIDNSHVLIHNEPNGGAVQSNISEQPRIAGLQTDSQDSIALEQEQEWPTEHTLHDSSDSESVSSDNDENPGDFDIGDEEGDILRKSTIFPQAPATKKIHNPPPLLAPDIPYDSMIPRDGYSPDEEPDVPDDTSKDVELKKFVCKPSELKLVCHVCLQNAEPSQLTHTASSRWKGTAIASSSIEDFLFKLYIKGCLQSNGSHDSKEKDVICCGSSCSIFVIRFPSDRVNYYKRHSEANCHNGTHCNEPHTELEEEVWSVFQKLKLSPVPPKEKVRILMTILARQQFSLKTWSEGPIGEDKLEYFEEHNFLDCPLDSINYQAKLHFLIDLEEHEHIRMLCNYDGSYRFNMYEATGMKKDLMEKYKWFGTLDLDQTIADIVRQAADGVTITCRSYKYTGRVLKHAPRCGERGRKFLLIGFSDGKKDGISIQKNEKHDVNFHIRHLYFRNMHKALLYLPIVAVHKLNPVKLEHGTASTQGCNIDTHDCKSLPARFHLDDDYQMPALRKLLSAPVDAPFLVTGPFGTGKTRLLATAANHILTSDKKSRILIITHHIPTAGEYIDNYFGQKMLEEEESPLAGKVLRLVSKDDRSQEDCAKSVSDFQCPDSTLKFEDYRLVITTFLCFLSVKCLRLKPGYFTHILVDEGAQAREPENVAAFHLVYKNTKIVIAGDHKQVGPGTTVLGEKARSKGFTESLLFRLYTLYKKMDAKRYTAVLLTNYRSHPEIIRLPSSLFYGNMLEGRSSSTLHPRWRQPMHFIVSSTERPPNCAWSGESELSDQTWKEVNILMNLVKTCYKYWPVVEWGKRQADSICVITPNRSVENMWKHLVYEESQNKYGTFLKKVSCLPAYLIQGREFKAIFICTSERVSQNFIPLEKTKSLCDPAVFNTVITRALSMIVAVGNPFRLLEIENKNYPKKNSLESCWFSYMRHCWETKSLMFPSQREKDWDSYSEIEAKIIRNMEGSLKQSTVTDLDNDDIIADYHRAFEFHHPNCKLVLGDIEGDLHWTAQLPEAQSQKKQSTGSGVECYLRQISRDHCLAIPIEKTSRSGPFSIIGPSQHRGAFDGAKVLVQEDREKSNPILHKTVGHISKVMSQGSMLPVICEVDVDNPDFFMPIDQISPKIANLPGISDQFLKRDIKHIKTALEQPKRAVVVCYDLSSIENGLPKISNTLSVEFAKDLLFVVRPLAWNPTKPYPEGAVIGMIPRGTSLSNAKRILYTQYQVERSPINLELGTDEVVHTPDYSDAIAICMSSEHDIANCAFSLSKRGDSYKVQVHIPNVASVLSRTSEFNEANFKHWYSFNIPPLFNGETTYYPVLSAESVKKLSFSKGSIQSSITFDITFSESNEKPFQGDFLLSNVKCCEKLTLKEAEKDYKRYSILETLLNLVSNIQPNDQFLCKVPKDISECPLVSGMVNTFLTYANMQAAERISLNMPKNVLLNVQPRPESYNERFQELIKDFSKVYNIGSDFAWLLELVNRPNRSLYPESGPLIRFDILEKVIKLLESNNVEQAKITLKAYDSFPEFIALLDAFESVLQEEEFSCTSKPKKGWPEKVFSHKHQGIVTSYCQPFDSIFDIYAQCCLLESLYPKRKDGNCYAKILTEVAYRSSVARSNSKKLHRDVSLLQTALQVQQSSIRCTALIHNVKERFIEFSLCHKGLEHFRPERVAIIDIGQITHSNQCLQFITKLTSFKTCNPFRYISENERQFRPVTSKKDQNTRELPKHILQLFAPDEKETLHELMYAIEYPTAAITLERETYKILLDFLKEPNSYKKKSSLQNSLSLKKARLFSQPRATSTNKPIPNHDQCKYLVKGKKDPHEPHYYKDVPFLILTDRLELKPLQPINVWIGCDPTGPILKPKIQLLELSPDLKICLQHQENPEACFTSGFKMVKWKKQWSSLDLYREFWEELLLAEGAANSIQKDFQDTTSDDGTKNGPKLSKANRCLVITDFELKFEGFEVPNTTYGEELYKPVGSITTTLSKDFVQRIQELFPIERGCLVCARYEIDLDKNDKLYRKYESKLGPNFDGYARTVLHLIIDKVTKKRKDLPHETEEVALAESNSLQNPDTVNISFIAVGEHNALISPLIKELLDKDIYTCELQLIPMALPTKRVYNALKQKKNKLSSIIALGDIAKLCREFATATESQALAKLKRNAFIYDLWDSEVPKDKKSDEFDTLEGTGDSRGSLNESQRHAIDCALNNVFEVIQGPPGTGKSVTGAHIAYAFAMLNREAQKRSADSEEVESEEHKKSDSETKRKLMKCVLYCAPSNRAVDIVTRMLKQVSINRIGRKKGIKILRMYGRGIERKDFEGPAAYKILFHDEETPAQPDATLQDESLHHLVHKHGNAKLLKDLEKQFSACAKAGEVPSLKDRLKYRELVTEAEEAVIRKGKFDIVLCTCNEAAGDRINKYFHAVQCVIDEASRCTEPEAMAPINLADRVVLIGDHKQLVPIIHSRLAEEKGLKCTLFERYAELLTSEFDQSIHVDDDYKFPFFTCLDSQYRMLSALCEFPSKEFYQGKLKDAFDVAKDLAPQCEELLTNLWPQNDATRPIAFCPIYGDVQESGKKHSYKNEKEADKAVSLVEVLRKAAKVSKSQGRGFSIGVLTFYKAQKECIKEKLEKKGLKIDEDCTVETVDASQGSQYGIVILSTVRSLPPEDICDRKKVGADRRWRQDHLGMVADRRHINVAITRARVGMIILGNNVLLNYDKTWESLWKRYNKNGYIIKDSKKFPSKNWIASIEEQVTRLQLH